MLYYSASGRKRVCDEQSPCLGAIYIIVPIPNLYGGMVLKTFKSLHTNHDSKKRYLQKKVSFRSTPYGVQGNLRGACKLPLNSRNVLNDF